MTEAADVSVVIVTYNSSDTIAACLESILNFREVIKEIVVVDNASRDNTAEIVKRYPIVKFYGMEKNMGFAAGNNLGVELTGGTYLLFSNPDVVFLSSSISKLRAALKENVMAGIVAPQIYSGDSKSKDIYYYKFPSLTVEFLRAFKLDKLVDMYNLDKSQHPHGIEKLDDGWPSGCCLMLKRKVLEECGGWDEHYGLFCEDIDIAWNVRRLGYEILFVPDAEILHFGGRSSQEIFKKRNAMILSARFYFYRKNYKLVKAIIFFLIRVKSFVRYWLKYRINFWFPEKNL